MKLYTYITLITAFLVLLFVIFIPLLIKGFIIGALSIVIGVNIYFMRENKGLSQNEYDIQKF